jgi:hypothetical protein
VTPADAYEQWAVELRAKLEYLDRQIAELTDEIAALDRTHEEMVPFVTDSGERGYKSVQVHDVVNPGRRPVAAASLEDCERERAKVARKLEHIEAKAAAAREASDAAAPR